MSFAAAATDLHLVLLIAVLSRALVFLTAALFSANFGTGRSFERLLCSWDCNWYLTIIEAGYDSAPKVDPLHRGSANFAFFPLHPMLAWALSKLGMSAAASAMLVANAAFIAGLCVLFKYVRKIADREFALFVVAALAFSPFAIYFSVPYTESLYFALMVGSLYAAASNRWIVAGVVAAALSATRNLGAFLIFPLLLIAVQQFGWRPLARFAQGTERAIACLAMVPFGLFAYMLFLHYRVGDALAFAHVQVAWGRQLNNPLKMLVDPLVHGDATAKFAALSAIASFAAVALLLRRKLYSEGALLFIGTFLPLLAGLQSLPRFIFTSFPIYIALALATRGHSRARTFILCGFLALNWFMVVSWVANKGYMV